MGLNGMKNTCTKFQEECCPRLICISVGQEGQIRKCALSPGMFSIFFRYVYGILKAKQISIGLSTNVQDGDLVSKWYAHYFYPIMFCYIYSPLYIVLPNFIANK